jgi:hypothetical protein
MSKFVLLSKNPFTLAIVVLALEENNNPPYFRGGIEEKSI